MPGHIRCVKFPTDDGELHQVYADVHEDTDYKLSLLCNRKHLLSRLNSLRLRPDEWDRRRLRPDYDVTIGIFHYPELNGDSMALALVITEYIASFIGANNANADGFLEHDAPQIIATGNVDEKGYVHSVGDIEVKIKGILEAIESHSVEPKGLFIYPASNSLGVTQFISKLEAKEWSSRAVNHIDEVIPPFWEPSLNQAASTEQSAWALWRRPLKIGILIATALVAISFFIFLPRLSDEKSFCASVPILEQAVCYLAEHFNP